MSEQAGRARFGRNAGFWQPHPSDAFGHRLVPGERVVWSGRQGLSVATIDLLQIGIGALFVFLGLRLLEQVVRDVGVVEIVFCVLVMAVGAFLLVVLPVLRTLQARRTHYGVTDGRVLVVRHAPFASDRSLALEMIRSVELMDVWMGGATLVFEHERRPLSPAQLRDRKRNPPLTFYGVVGAWEVRRVVEELRGDRLAALESRWERGGPTADFTSASS